jgi:pimeloyl-ACP methyl ester carboxylesterase
MAGLLLVAAPPRPAGRSLRRGLGDMKTAAVARNELADHATTNADSAVAAGLATADAPGTVGAHELVLLHGQPGSSADWQQVAGRLPRQLHAVAVDRPGYGSSPRPAVGFAAGARTVLAELDSRGIQRAVLVGHSYGGGVALSAASLAPHRVEAVVLLASVGPGCVNAWDRRGGPLGPDEHVNWQIWGHTSRDHGSLWRTFLAEQRALLRELDELVSAVPLVRAPVLLLADPTDTVVRVGTARRLAQTLPDARLQLVMGAGHHLPRRAPDVVARAITAFIAAVESASAG